MGWTGATYLDLGGGGGGGGDGVKVWTESQVVWGLGKGWTSPRGRSGG